MYQNVAEVRTTHGLVVLCAAIDSCSQDIIGRRCQESAHNFIEDLALGDLNDKLHEFVGHDSCSCAGVAQPDGHGGPDCTSTRGVPGAPFCLVIPGSCTDGILSGVLSFYEWSYEACTAPVCPQPDPPTTPPTLFDLSDQQGTVQKLITPLSTNVLTASNLNKAIEAGTKIFSGTAGTLGIQGELAIFSIGNLHIGASNLTVSGLNSIYNASLLNVVGPHSVDNALAAARSVPIRAALGIEFAIPNSQTSDLFTISVSVTDFELMLGMLLEVDQGRLWNLQLSQFLNIGCWLDTILTVQPTAIRLSFGGLQIGLDCISCTSEALLGMADRLAEPHRVAEITTSMNSVLRDLASFFVDDDRESTCHHLDQHASSLFAAVMGAAELSPPDYLTKERALLAANSSQPAIDLTESFAFQLVRPGLSSIFADRSDDSGRLGINDLIVKATDGTGNFSFSPSVGLYHDESDGASRTLTLSRVKLSGIDTFRSIDPLNLIGRYTMEHSAVLDRLGVELTIRVAEASEGVSNSTCGESEPFSRTEDMTVRLELHGLQLNLSTLIALDSGRTTLQSFKNAVFNDGHGIGCVLAALDAANITIGFLSVDSISEPKIVGGVQPLFPSAATEELCSIVNNGAAAALCLAKAAAMEVLPAMFASIEALLDEYIASLIMAAQQHTHGGWSWIECIPEDVGPSDAGTFVNFETDPVVPRLKKMLKPKLSPAGLNGVISSMTFDESGVEGQFSLRGQSGDCRDKKKECPDWLLQNECVVNSVYMRTWCAYSCGLCEGVAGGTLYEGGFTMTDGKDICLTCGQIIGTVSAKVSAVSISGMNSIQNASLLDISSPYVIRNSIEVGEPNDVVLAADFGLQISGMELDDVVTVSVIISDIKAVLGLLLKVDQQKLWGLHAEDLGNLDCWLGTIAVIKPTELALLFGRLRVELDCHSCTSPGLLESAAKLKDPAHIQELTAAVNHLLASLADQFTNDEDVFYRNQLLYYSERCAGAGAAALEVVAFNASLVGGAGPAPAPTFIISPDFILSPNAWSTLFMVVIGSSLAISCVACCFVKRARRRLKRQRGKTFSALGEPEELYHQRGTYGTQLGSSLLYSGVIPLRVRWGFLLLLCVNICFFLMGHLTVGAHVDIVVRLAGQETRVNNFVQFSLGNSLKDMWRARQYELVALIGGFSGVWPYTKMLCLLASWTLPPSLLTAKKRGQLLMALDILGKWSLIDLYVLVMTMLGFRIKMQSPTVPYLSDQLWDVDLKVTPAWGLYSFTLAAIGSLCLSHVALAYHRNAVSAAQRTRTLSGGRGARGGQYIVEMDSIRDRRRPAEPAEPMLDESVSSGVPSMYQSGAEGSLSLSPRSNLGSFTAPDHLSPSSASPSWLDSGTSDVSGLRAPLTQYREALRDHLYDSAGYRIGFGVTGQLLVTLMLVTATLLTAGGGLVSAFRIQTRGLVGILADLGDQGSGDREYSLAGAMWALTNQADADESAGTHVGIWFIAVTGFLFAYVVPVACLLCKLAMWVAPLKLRGLKRLHLLNEVLNAWAGLEIFLVAIVVALAELGQLSKLVSPHPATFLTDDAEPIAVPLDRVLGAHPAALLVFPLVFCR